MAIASARRVSERAVLSALEPYCMLFLGRVILWPNPLFFAQGGLVVSSGLDWEMVFSSRFQ